VSAGLDGDAYKSVRRRIARASERALGEMWTAVYNAANDEARDAYALGYREALEHLFMEQGQSPDVAWDNAIQRCREMGL
jgi:hypothetical protein